MIARHCSRRIFAVALFCVFPAVGQQVAIDFDPAQTKIVWSLTGNVHTTHGTFQLKDGHVSFDPANGDASGELVVEAASGESGNSSRDKRMDKEVLEIDMFPQVRLKVSKVEGWTRLDTPGSLRILGALTIHGASHQVSIPMQVNVSGSEVSGKGKFVVPFVDWGMRDPSNFLFKVNKTVAVELVAVGRLAR